MVWHHRASWHIDGCPGDFIKGVTDHYGHIHNFDVLVGVLLNRVDDEMCVATIASAHVVAGWRAAVACKHNPLQQ